MITAFILKLLAMITMTTDHIGWSFMDGNMIMTTIGRIAFLLYAFMIAEGFYHLKDKPDRIKSHIIKLAILTIFAEMGYDFMEAGVLVDWSQQSVMLVLLMGFIGLWITEKFKSKPWIIVLYYAGSAAANYFGQMNFRLTGVLIIYAFYFFILKSREKNWSYLQKLGVLLIIITIYYLVYNWGRVDFGTWAAWKENFIAYGPWLIGHYAAMCIIAGYNGKQGPRNKAFQFVYTIYYPAHPFVVGALKLLVGSSG